MNLETLWLDNSYQRVDLTRKLRNSMPVWPTHPPFRQEAIASFDKGDIACNHSLSLSEHSGTHFDAPLHFVPGGRSIDAVPLERFFGRMLTIDVSDVEPDSLVGHEPHRGVRTSQWRRSRPTMRSCFISAGRSTGIIRAKRSASSATGRDSRAKHPSSWSAAKCGLVATDCMSIDNFSSTEFPAHRTLLGADILIGENFDKLSTMPPICYLATLPLPIEGGSGSPLRAIAFVVRRR